MMKGWACYTRNMKNTKKSTTKRTDWHAGFAGGIEISLEEYLDLLDINREYELTKESPRIDFLVIKKTMDAVIDNDIGRIFRKHNIIEFKNPNDVLNIDVIWKCIGYAGLYKGLAKRVNEIPENELTISIFRSRKPVGVFNLCKREGKTVTNPYPGVYYLEGFGPIPIQVIITRDLKGDAFRALRIMATDADEDDIRKFLQVASGYKLPGMRQDANAVIRVSSSANRDAFDKVTKEDAMKDVLREIAEEVYADEIAKAAAEAEDRTRAESTRNLMDSFKLTAKEAMNALKIPVKDQKRIVAML